MKENEVGDGDDDEKDKMPQRNGENTKETNERDRDGDGKDNMPQRHGEKLKRNKKEIVVMTRMTKTTTHHVAEFVDFAKNLQC